MWLSLWRTWELQLEYHSEKWQVILQIWKCATGRVAKPVVENVDLTEDTTIVFLDKSFTHVSYNCMAIYSTLHFAWR